MKSVSAVLVLALVLALQACSSSSPSTSDVTKAIKADFQDCQNLAIENVKMINGVKVDEVTHQIHASFDLRVIPLPQKLLDEADETNRQFQAEAKANSDLVEELQKQDEALNKESGKLHVQEMGVIPLDPGTTKDDLEQQKQKNESDLAELEPKLYAARAATPATKPIDLGSEWGSKDCQAKSGVAFAGYGGGDMREAVTKGQVKSYDVNFTMRKTDNGWMETN